MKITFDVKMQSKYMYNFLLSHVYRSAMGVFGILIGLAAWALTIYSFSIGSNYMICYLAVAILALLYPPIMLWMRSKQQVAMSPVFKEASTYELDDEGVRVIQKGQEAFGKWSDFYKITSTKMSIILYMDKKRAMIWPKDCMGNQYTSVVALIKDAAPADKVKL